MKKIFAIALSTLCILAILSMNSMKYAQAESSTLRIKYVGDAVHYMPEEYLESHGYDLSNVNLKFYVNEVLVDKVLADNDTTLLLPLENDNNYTLIYEVLDYPYWIYTFNLTHRCSFYIDTSGKIDVNSIYTGQVGGEPDTRYNPTTNTLYIGYPLPLSSPQYNISWDRVAVVILIPIIAIVAIVALVIWKKKRKR